MELIAFFLFLSCAASLYWLFKVKEVNKNLEKELVHYKTKEGLLSDKFQSLSNEIFQRNSQSFLQIAEQRFDKLHEVAKNDLNHKEKNLKEILERYEKRIEEFSKEWVIKSSNLDQHLKTLFQNQIQLRQEAQNLSKALRQPHVRGRWGEIQLKRVVEMAGMVEYCDFTTQEVSETSRLRPDMVVRLPNERQIVIDSKAPLFAYLEALECQTEEEKLVQLKNFSRHIKKHIQDLSQKSYWDQFSPTPEFVVLFLPGETFFSAALEQDPCLIEIGVEQKVLVATPTTLIALLRSVAYGWRQEKMAKNAEDISCLGRELYKRLTTMNDHFEKMRSSIDNVVENYNKFATSLESRVLVTARKFKDLGVIHEEEIDLPKTIDKIPKIAVFDK